MFINQKRLWNLFHSLFMLLRKVFYYDNKHSLTAFCIMGSDIMDKYSKSASKYFRSAYIIRTLLWIPRGITYWSFPDPIDKSLSLGRKSCWYTSCNWFDYRTTNNKFVSILLASLCYVGETSYNNFASFTIHVILLVSNQGSFGSSTLTPHKIT